MGTLCFEGFGCWCCVKSAKAPIGVNKINRTKVEGVLALNRWDENGGGGVCVFRRCECWCAVMGVRGGRGCMYVRGAAG